MSGEQDPGALVGQKPEREADSIPGGIKPGDERIAAPDSAPGVLGEPNAEAGDDDIQSEMDLHREAGQAIDGASERANR